MDATTVRNIVSRTVLKVYRGLVKGTDFQGVEDTDTIKVAFPTRRNVYVSVVSVCLSVGVFYMSVSVSLCLFLCVSVSVSVSVSVCLFLCVSVCLYLCVFRLRPCTRKQSTCASLLPFAANLLGNRGSGSVKPKDELPLLLTDQLLLAV